MRGRAELGRFLVAWLLLALLAPGGLAQRRPTYTNPVVPHDFPDPTVVRANGEFWSMATGGGWAPIFPVMRSADLVNWSPAGAVFERAPAWAERDFWAPELVHHRGRYFVYYTARKRGGPLCVAAASAPSPTGPYTDHGPLVCQDLGSIDASTVEDERGDLYLLWKEDGNSRGLPTPIWAQRLAADGITLEGEPVELIRNDAPWERHVVEGQFVVRRGDWYYMFYSGNACCGRDCDYALGVARARAVLGPWEKNPANPILPPNAGWRCPGHGTIVDDGRGRDYLMYHSYSRSSDAFQVGRVALLDLVEWKADGWPEINDGRGPSGRARAPLGAGEPRAAPVTDEFAAAPLGPEWRWPIHQEAIVRFESGELVLEPEAARAGDPVGAILARPHRSGSYTAVARLSAEGEGAVASLAALSWRDNALGVGIGGGEVVVWRRERGNHRVLARAPAPGNAPSVWVRVTASGGSRYRFAFSRDGRRWRALGGEVRAGTMELVNLALVVGGPKGARGRFDSVRARYRD